jgi:hypothetical protein
VFLSVVIHKQQQNNSLMFSISNTSAFVKKKLAAAGQFNGRAGLPMQAVFVILARKTGTLAM